MSIRAKGISWRAGKRQILDRVSLEAEPGRVLGLIGPNGSGKTSLLRILAGLRRPDAGQVEVDGEDLRALGRRRLARRIAFVEQHGATNADLRVCDVVKLGRFPHRSPFSGWTGADEAAVADALARTGLTDRRFDRWQNLSGGERQRVHIARALAQTPSELILDEPTNHLDVHHQIGLLQLVAGLDVTCIVSLHDLNHAALFCDRVVVLSRGRVVASGPPAETLTETLLREVFAVDARVATSPHHGRPHIHFLPFAKGEIET
ncbi:ABC transporter ATP-binding protein [Aureimonas jatrophae]|uniref:Iron complex transport system ATP-binding protein n=1 Tax=Aureimonas jatrophae TaxID=1166073 RepID=A0A1H0F6P8_9HYPH|nr:ABC transporter ATP-binding protein [Aureimonas jatrophae]MBB3950153.1 iron complex transport system ATP-binding protein [Aureimonas jatrophae]SDN90314.1 iron complex transport system ATP-binding protein [Aureimonas jatrophae]